MTSPMKLISGIFRRAKQRIVDARAEHRAKKLFANNGLVAETICLKAVAVVCLVVVVVVVVAAAAGGGTACVACVLLLMLSMYPSHVDITYITSTHTHTRAHTHTNAHTHAYTRTHSTQLLHLHLGENQRKNHHDGRD